MCFHADVKSAVKSDPKKSPAVHGMVAVAVPGPGAFPFLLASSAPKKPAGEPNSSLIHFLAKGTANLLIWRLDGDFCWDTDFRGS